MIRKAGSQRKKHMKNYESREEKHKKQLHPKTSIAKLLQNT